MPTVTRKLEWDSGHRVLNHGGKCRHLHGHRYVAEITVEATQLNDLGMVVDFSLIKERVGKWIDENWDHNFLAHPEDPILILSDQPAICLSHTRKIHANAVFGDKPPFVMPPGENPTAENLAKKLFKVSRHLLIGDRLKVVKVKIWETPNCAAEYDEHDWAADALLDKYHQQNQP